MEGEGSHSHCFRGSILRTIVKLQTISSLQHLLSGGEIRWGLCNVQLEIYGNELPGTFSQFPEGNLLVVSTVASSLKLCLLFCHKFTHE